MTVNTSNHIVLTSLLSWPYSPTKHVWSLVVRITCTGAAASSPQHQLC